jgi:hypothetical protein
VLDLTDQKVLAALQISAAAPVAGAPDLTRRIGRQALDAGYDAIISPLAAREGGKSLVIFLSAAAAVPPVKASTPVDLSPKGGFMSDCATRQARALILEVHHTTHIEGSQLTLAYDDGLCRLASA